MNNSNTNWALESVRCTAFPAPDGDFDPTDWWASIVGEQPDQVVTKPAEGKFQAQGKAFGGILQLVVQPLRIQWSLGPALDEEETESWQVPNVGDIARISDFREIVNGWLSLAPELSRIAFGAVLLDIVENTPAAYAKLDALLPSVNIGDAPVQDFLFQINRKRSSENLAGVEINRLSKWSAVVISPVTIQIGAGEQVRQSVGDGVTAVRLEVDINNVPDNSARFVGDESKSLYDELASLGLEISAEGDVA